jgi:hypothetical protein
MTGWEEVVFKGSSVSDLGLKGVAQGDVLVAGATPFTFAVLTKGADGTFLKAGASTLSWAAPSIAKLEDITDVEAYAGNGGKVLAVNAGADDVEWISAVAGDFKADGTVPMTDNLDFANHTAKDMKLHTTIPAVPADGHIYFDSVTDKVKIYVA